MRILYGPNSANKAEGYIRRISAAHPSGSFRFYVYDSLPEDRTWSYLSRCIERKLNRPGKKGNKYGNRTSNCDWGTSICSQTTRSSGYYSSRRFNRNGDVILSRLFSEYKGKLRTYDANEADVFIVPYASTADCACHNTKARCFKIKSHMIAENVLDHLEHLSPASLSRHVFFNSAQGDVAQPTLREMPLLVGMEPMRDMVVQGKKQWTSDYTLCKYKRKISAQAFVVIDWQQKIYFALEVVAGSAICHVGILVSYQHQERRAECAANFLRHSSRVCVTESNARWTSSLCQ